MATRRFKPGHAYTIRRYGPSSVHPEVNPQVDLGDGGAKGFLAIKHAADAALRFFRPAAVEEATAKGETEALDDLRDGKFQYRNPYTVRSKAYNEAARRVMGASVRADYAARVGDVVSGAGSEAELMAGLNSLADQVTSGLPDQFSDVRSGLYEQSAAMFMMARGRFADASPVYLRDRGAADTARANVDATVDAAVAAAAAGRGDPAAIDAVVGQVVAGLAEFGPSNDFTVGGVNFAADERRPGLISAEEISAVSEAASQRMVTAVAETGVMRADVLSPMIAEIEEGRSPLTPEVSDRVLSRARAELRLRSARLAGEMEAARAHAQIFDGRAIPPGVEIAVSPYDMITARSVTAGMRAGEIVAELSDVPIPAQMAELDAMAADLAVSEDAEIISGLLDGLTQISAAARSGALVDNYTLSVSGIEVPTGTVMRGRVAWANTAANLISKVLDAGPGTVEQAEAIADAAAKMLAVGQAHGRAAGVGNFAEIEAIERAAGELDRRDASGAVAVVRGLGLDVPAVGFSGTLGDVAQSLIERSATMTDARLRLGLQTGGDLTQGEGSGLALALAAAPLPERVAFFEQMAEVPLDARRRLVAGIKDAFPVVAAAFTAAAINPMAAARAIDQAPVAQVFDRTLVDDMAGADAVALADDLSAVGVANAAGEALQLYGQPVLLRAYEAGVAPEDVDADLSPAQSARLRAAQVREFDIAGSDPADEVSDRIDASPDAAALADAVGYTPDSPEAVAAMRDLLSQMDALPAEARGDFIDGLASERRQRELQSYGRPLFYDGPEITRDGLQAAAQRIVTAYRSGRISENVYAVQAALIQNLLPLASETKTSTESGK